MHTSHSLHCTLLIDPRSSLIAVSHSRYSSRGLEILSTITTVGRIANLCLTKIARAPPQRAYVRRLKERMCAASKSVYIDRVGRISSRVNLGAQASPQRAYVHGLQRVLEHVNGLQRVLGTRGNASMDWKSIYMVCGESRGAGFASKSMYMVCRESRGAGFASKSMYMVCRESRGAGFASK
jgi:hypothetical protein